MNILFKRRELQVECERIARIQQGLPNNSEEFQFKNLLEVTNSELTKLKECQSHDSVAFYFNAAYSFLQGLKSFSNKSYSWATVQLYYSVFYSCKAILGFNNIAIIRKNGLCKLELKLGSKAKGFKHDNDHKQTIKCYTDSFPSAFILSNDIIDQNFFEWIQDAREITNYRQQVFQEPRSLNFLTTIISRIKNGDSIKKILDVYSSDWHIYCFQEDSALFAGSYHLLFEAYNLYSSQQEKLTVPEKLELRKLVKELKIADINTKIIDP